MSVSGRGFALEKFPVPQVPGDGVAGESDIGWEGGGRL